MQLHEKHRPKTISDFVGLEKPKKILSNFAARPMATPFLFEGRSGRGKTAMAVALAAELKADLHLSPAHECTRENIARLWERCRYAPKYGSEWHMVLVDQADKLAKLHQSDLRSKLDGPEKLPNVIWVFTADSSEELDEGFRSRCLTILFSNHGAAPALAEHLAAIWHSEAAGANAVEPNFLRIVKEAKGNMFTALSQLQHHLT